MIGHKILLTFCIGTALAAMVHAYSYDAPTCETIDDHFTMFPASDPRSFYVCLPDGNPKLVNCESGQVFVDSSDVYGCAPYDLAPCNKGLVAINCSGPDLNTLVKSEDPAKYWICAAPSATPTELPCPQGKGFVKNSTHMGCITWTEWTC